MKVNRYAYIADLVKALGVPSNTMWCDSAGCRTIEGSRGNVPHSWGDNGRWSIFLDDRADGYDDQERKLLVFMQPGYSPNNNQNRGDFYLERLPTPEEAAVVREVLGMRTAVKKPSLRAGG